MFPAWLLRRLVFDLQIHWDAHARLASPLTPCVQLAFDLFDQMRAQGLAPSAVTYGCLLSACERSGNVDLGFELYKQACDEVGKSGRRLPPERVE